MIFILIVYLLHFCYLLCIIYANIFIGLPMYIIPDDAIYDPPRLLVFLRTNKITRMLFTPSLLQTVLDYRGINIPEGFKTLK